MSRTLLKDCLRAVGMFTRRMDSVSNTSYIAEVIQNSRSIQIYSDMAAHWPTTQQDPYINTPHSQK